MEKKRTTPDRAVLHCHWRFLDMAAHMGQAQAGQRLKHFVIHKEIGACCECARWGSKESGTVTWCKHFRRQGVLRPGSAGGGHPDG